ncbi:MAG: WXG100 family type VII secretion target [Lachnospiraceae bacterium]|nr:WXG100 family type VII secretion target [Lachnospiraceae bacterium]
MAAEGMIKVSPELLSNTATDLSGKATQLQTLTGQMLELADGLTSAWQGEAATAYITKFHQLDDDMQKMYRMIQEHSADLTEMAAAYSQAENQNAELAQSLVAEVIS